jgi:putative FmdB family regulatory protein
VTDAAPSQRAGLIGIERELELDRSDGHASSLPNRCSTCQIHAIVRTLAQMPLYEYRCNDCSAVYELLRPMADREVAAVCPSCESRASMPLISRVAVHAGSGSDESPSASGGGGGGCCGGSCGCSN